MQIDLTNKTALVTGAASGIGFGIATALHNAGAAVVIADINAAAAQDAASNIGSRAHAVTLDVADVDACRAVTAQVIDQHGQLDILVNNAGVAPLKDITEVEPNFYDRVFAINLRGAYFLSQAAAQHMKSRSTGRIINISSVGGRTGGSLALSVYAMTKAALFSMTKSFANYLAPGGTVNTVAPGPSHTPLTEAWDNPDGLKWLEGQIPLGRLGTPDDYAGVVTFLASDHAAYITGATLDVNGGFRME